VLQHGDVTHEVDERKDLITFYKKNVNENISPTTGHSIKRMSTKIFLPRPDIVLISSPLYVSTRPSGFRPL
jgi:hypothetical protein